MAIIVASAASGDDEFLEQFVGCTLPAARFRHGDHLRLVWILLHRQPLEQALMGVREGIQRFAAHLGVPHLYHETITTAWVRLMATHDEKTFEEFIFRNEGQLTRELLYRFWSPEVLDSDAARAHWVPPDKRELPR
jgi:hypothetical protein